MQRRIARPQHSRRCAAPALTRPVLVGVLERLGVGVDVVVACKDAARPELGPVSLQVFSDAAVVVPAGGWGEQGGSAEGPAVAKAARCKCRLAELGRGGRGWAGGESPETSREALMRKPQLGRCWL
jgi:hypothetical protein